MNETKETPAEILDDDKRSRNVIAWLFVSIMACLGIVSGWMVWEFILKGGM